MKNAEQKTSVVFCHLAFKWALIDTDNLHPNYIFLATLPLPRKSSLTFCGVLEGLWSLSNLLSHVNFLRIISSKESNICQANVHVT